MKKALLFAPIVVSLLVLGAHFLRYGQWWGVAAAVVLIGLLFVRQPWVARTIQLVLLAGAAEWGWTLFQLAQMRAAHDQPIVRLVAILGSVVLVTLLSAWLFQTATLRAVYGMTSRQPQPHDHPSGD
jgi:hypothetical protein